MLFVPVRILETFQKRYSFAGSKLTPFHLGEEGSDGAVYRFNGQKTLLKVCFLGEGDTRQARLRFEHRLAFLFFLCQRGLPVVELIPSSSGKHCEVIDEGEAGSWAAYAMNQARGKTPSPKVWDPAFIEAWGSIIGRLHSAARDYPVWENTLDPETGKPLLSWQSEWENFYQLSQAPEIREAWQAVHDELAAFPVERDCFGLVHNDPHLWNLHWDGQEATLLDFEVANHHWFLNDIAIAPQHVLFMLSGGLSAPMHHPERLGDFLRVFLKAYARENPLPESWRDRLEVFFAYRRLLLYTVMAGWRESDQELGISWKHMILSRPRLLDGIKL